MGWRSSKAIAELSAVPDVFNTTELIEEILVLLDMKTLLLAQRVCKKWKAVIGANPSLQKLFMIPLRNIQEAIELNMIEPRLFAVRPTRHTPTFLGLCTSSADFALPNTMLDYTWHYGHINLDVKSLRGKARKRLMDEAKRTARSFIGKPTYEPSWCNMLLTQPPRD